METTIVENIKSLISNEDVSDNRVKEEIEKIGIDTLTKSEEDDILNFLQQQRPALYRNWQLEIVSNYM